MYYSTLKEAYDEESFEKKRKKVSSKEKFYNQDYSNQEECYYKNKYNIDTGSCPEKFTNPIKKLNEKETNKEHFSQNNTKSADAPNVTITTTNQQYKSGHEISPSIYNIQPYYDEDLDKYLNVNEFNKKQIKEEENVIKIETKKPDIPDATNVINTSKAITKEDFLSRYNPVPLNKKDIFYKNIINIGLFIFIGILIIFICEQISEIAINIGMRKTLLLLEPYLQNLQQKNI